MADAAFDLLEELSESEEATAVIAGSGDETDDDEGVKTTIAKLASMQQRRKPQKIQLQRVELVSYSGVDTANRPVLSSTSRLHPNSLAIKEGVEYHNFSDGYDEIEVHFLDKSQSSNNATFIDTIPIHLFNLATEPDDPEVRIAKTFQTNARILRVSDTSFAIYDLPQSDTFFLHAIYGLRPQIVLGS